MVDGHHNRPCHPFATREQANQIDQIKRLTQIGVALSAEKNLDRLLEMIVDEARFFTHADGGTLYIMTDDETALQFAIVQTDSLNIRMGGTSGKITWPAVPLKNSDGTLNYANVSAYAALSGEVVNIPDVYDADGFNFEGTRQFDRNTGYRSQSMLVAPMRNHENTIIGVLQLLNARDPSSGIVVPFSLECQGMTESLASQAAVSLTNNRLIHDLEVLLDSFIRSIATAIDEKSPYTGGHVRRVAELTMVIAGRINEVREGPYADVFFNDNELKELRLAAWLHDVGKITTPEHVLDKASKLETVFNRMALLEMRFELLRRDHEIEKLTRLVKEGQQTPGDTLNESDDFIQSLEEDYQFLLRDNSGSESIADEQIARLKRIAERKYFMDNQWRPLLNDDELKNLSVRQGTLTSEEKNIINNHAAVTYKMLSQLPFPRNLRHVAECAAAHHEKMDGTGYPGGLKGEEISLQSRILALADVFEALTAKDRPYKKPITLSQALNIIGRMVQDGHIDADLFELFVNEQIRVDYARKELTPQQIDQP
ncbi:MAG: metal-dependent phosphohydrolase [Deltaproteobacteria bacterium HGW-Deltaproteobacteria-11]|nr:MAG: metal-dependent phosphohydrolase [Deltaproteobacteria bacterium HGW-Deltaproteobacteria-11]